MAPSNSVFCPHPASFRHLSCCHLDPGVAPTLRQLFRLGVVVACCGGERNRADRGRIRIFARIVTFYASR
jgi:hypothetical protein